MQECFEGLHNFYDCDERIFYIRRSFLEAVV